MFFYGLLGDNLGLAVILLAVLVRLALIPAFKKQMDMSKKMGDMRPKLKKLQKKYKHNQEELAKAQMKLYKEVGYNPLGCVGTFLPQMLILIAIIGIIRNITGGEIEGLYGFVRDFTFGDSSPVISESGLNFLWFDMSEQYTDLVDGGNYFKLEALPYLLLGLSVGVVQYFSTRFSQRLNGSGLDGSSDDKKSDKKDDELSMEEMQQSMMKSMMTIFPVMSAVVTLNAPSVLGVYWLIQSLMFIIQYLVLDLEGTKRVFAEILPFVEFDDASAVNSKKKSKKNVKDAEVVEDNTKKNKKKRKGKKKAKKA